MADFTGQTAHLSQFVAMGRNRVFPREAARRLRCSRRRIERWIHDGRITKDAHGKIAFADALALHRAQRTGRQPGREPKTIRELKSKLSPKERALIDAYLMPGGMRRLERALNALALAANHWTPAIKQRWVEKLRDGAAAIQHGQPTLARERQRQRLTDASRTRVTKKSRTIIYPQAGPDAREMEFVPFFRTGIKPEDERYLFAAGDPFEFLRRADERGIEMSVERSDANVNRPHPLAERHEHDIAAEIDAKTAPNKPDRTEDILAKYQAITDASERRRFLLENKKAIHAARASVAKRHNFDLLMDLAERKNREWIRTDDGYAYKSVTRKSTP